MVIDIINVQRVAVRKAENHPPVGAYRDRPKTFQLALERMKLEARHIYIGESSGGVQAYQNVTHLLQMFPTDPARVAVLVKAFQSFVASETIILLP